MTEKSLTDAAAAGERTGNARFVKILSFFGSCESSPQDLTTVDGASIWAGDGVHLTSSVTRVAARRLMADLSSGGQGDEPANKRARLESVIPTPAAAGEKEAAKNQQPTPPPPPRPCLPPLWLSGQLPAAHRGRRRGRGSGSSYRGGQPTRGGQPGQPRPLQRRPIRPLVMGRQELRK
jgi:hypothetical protein